MGNVEIGGETPVYIAGPCAIEDGEEKTSAWERFKARFHRRRRLPETADLPPLEPQTLPEPPESDHPDEIG